jgi:hypothetical protein
MFTSPCSPGASRVHLKNSALLSLSHLCCASAPFLAAELQYATDDPFVINAWRALQSRGLASGHINLMNSKRASSAPATPSFCSDAGLWGGSLIRCGALSLPPPAHICDRMLGVRAHAPHDTSRTSARDSCGRHRRSPLRPRSHTPAMPSDAPGGWPCLHPPCVFSREHHHAHYSAHGHMQRRA